MILSELISSSSSYTFRVAAAFIPQRLVWWCDSRVRRFLWSHKRTNLVKRSVSFLLLVFFTRATALWNTVLHFVQKFHQLIQKTSVIRSRGVLATREIISPYWHFCTIVFNLKDLLRWKVLLRWVSCRFSPNPQRSSPLLWWITKAEREREGDMCEH